MIEKPMPRTTHVVRRGATYYFRIRIPAGLVSHYGKKEITFSLKTKDQTEAKRKGHVEALRLLDEFKRAGQTSVTSTVETMSPEEINKVAQGWLHDLLSEDEAQRRSGRVSAQDRLAIEVLEDHARPTLAGDWDHDDGDSRRWMTTLVRQEVAALNRTVPPEGDLENDLIYAFAEAAVRGINAIKERNKGKVVATPDRPLLPSVDRPARSESGKQIRLSSVIEGYSKEQETAGNWQGKTGPENRAIFRLLIDIIEDLPASELGHPQLVAFKNALQRLPANLNKDPRYRGRSIPDILVMPDVKPMSTTTVNKYLTRASSLLKWAVRHGYVTHNYADGLSISQRGKKASDSRRMFETAHLEAIFKAIAERRVTASGAASSFHYWLPLLGYLTGARVNEIASLRVSDFHLEDNVPFISITQQNDGAKATKTQAGIRNIPLHPALIRLGLLDHVETLRNQGQARLFPELKLTKNGYGSKVTSWFSGHTSKADSFLHRNAGVTEDKLSFHSYRHTMATLLERQDTGKVLTKRILGHSLSDDVTYGRYSKGANLSQMLDALIKALPEKPIGNLPAFERWLMGNNRGA